MAESVYLHIGAPKTGSSYLQTILRRNLRRLTDDGVWSPQDGWRPSLDLRSAKFQNYADPKTPGAWKAFVDKARTWPGTVLISHESFASCDPEQIERAVTDLGFAELHVICTARDLVRQVPAVWQEGLKNRRSISFEDFVASLQEGRPEERIETPGFWRSQHTSTLLERWSRYVDSERIHLVTVPPSGSPPGLLWQRFASVPGLNPDDYDTDVGERNTSLGAPGAAVMRRVNRRLVADDVPWPVYQTAVKGLLASTMTPQSRAERISLSPEHYAWARACAVDMVAGLRGRPYRIVGDLDELVPPEDPPPANDPPDVVSTEAQLEAAVGALAAVTTRYGELKLSERELRRRMSEQRRRQQARVGGETARRLADTTAVRRARRQGRRLLSRSAGVARRLRGQRRASGPDAAGS